MSLPGLLDSRADEQRTIARLETNDVRLVALSARDFSAFGFRTFGTDYNRLLGDYLKRKYRSRATFGDFAAPVAGSYPSAAYKVLERR